MNPHFLSTVAHLLFVTIVAVSVVGAALTGMQAVESEAGLIEVMSGLTLSVALILFCLRTGAQARHAYWYGTTALAFLLAREFDLDKMLFEQGILSVKHYVGAAPLWQKAAGAVIVSGLAFALYTLVIRGARPLLQGLITLQDWALLFVVAMALLVAGKTLDGAGRKMSDFGVELSLSHQQIALFIEEVAELGAELCILLMVVRMPLQMCQTHHTALGRHHDNA